MPPLVLPATLKSFNPETPQSFYVTSADFMGKRVIQPGISERETQLPLPQLTELRTHDGSIFESRKKNPQ